MGHWAEWDCPHSMSLQSRAVPTLRASSGCESPATKLPGLWLGDEAPRYVAGLRALLPDALLRKEIAKPLGFPQHQSSSCVAQSDLHHCPAAANMGHGQGKELQQLCNPAGPGCWKSSLEPWSGSYCDGAAPKAILASPLGAALPQGLNTALREG